jgi:hypothetical protein
VYFRGSIYQYGNGKGACPLGDGWFVPNITKESVKCYIVTLFGMNARSLRISIVLRAMLEH